MKNSARKIFISGGHITPAIALCDEIYAVHPDWTLFLAGRTQALEGGGKHTIEEDLAAQKNIQFLPLSTGRVTRTLSFRSITSALKIPMGFLTAMRYCLRYRPDLVISFGGYIALPVAVAAWILGIPIVMHEQTLVPGLANRMIAKLARKICLTFEDRARVFDEHKSVITGLPIRKELLRKQSVTPFPWDRKKPILYITGGSTGAVSLNEMIFPIVPELVKKYTVVHQTGATSRAKALHIRSELGSIAPKAYIVNDYFDAAAVCWILSHAALVVSRSGANTVIELALFQKHAILVPLPWSGGGEQLAHAQWLKKRGLARIIPQQSVNFSELLGAIDEEVKKTGKPPVSETEIRTDGAHRMLMEIDAILS